MMQQLCTGVAMVVVWFYLVVWCWLCHFIGFLLFLFRCHVCLIGVVGLWFLTVLCWSQFWTNNMHLSIYYWRNNQHLYIAIMSWIGVVFWRSHFEAWFVQWLCGLFVGTLLGSTLAASLHWESCCWLMVAQLLGWWQLAAVVVPQWWGSDVV